MANSIYYNHGNDGVTINAKGVGDTQATFDAQAYAEFDPADTTLGDAVSEQGGHVVDVEGTEEALTAGTIQTATTLSALSIRNSTGATVLNVRDSTVGGTIRFGPITVAANAERVIVFPTQLPASLFATGVYVEELSGALHATPGFLIP
jgi:hypothetical protein